MEAHLMTRDDIISMAREAGMERVIDVHKDGTRTIELPHPDLLERFAAIVAAVEREACAKVCERLPAQQDIDVRDQCAAAIRERGKNAHR